MATTTDPLSLSQLAELLIKHHGLHEGIYDLSIEFNFALGAVGPTPEQLLPGAMIGISRIGLVPSKDAGPNSVDAAKVNPPKKTRNRAKKPA